MTRRSQLIVVGLLLTVGTCSSQVLLTDFSTQTLDFTGYTGAGFSPAPGAGQLDSDAWAVTGLSSGTLAFGGTQTSGDFALGTSAGNAGEGGLYSFTGVINGGTGSFGVQPRTGDWSPGTATLRLQNMTGTTLSGIAIAYEVWVNNNTDRASSFNLSYSTDDVSYTSVSGLNLTSVQASDALGFQKNDRSTTVTGLSVADGSFVYVRWSGDEVSGTGAQRDEFALDNFQVTAVPEPREYVVIAGLGLLGFAALRRWSLKRA